MIKITNIVASLLLAALAHSWGRVRLEEPCRGLIGDKGRSHGSRVKNARRCGISPTCATASSVWRAQVPAIVAPFSALL